MSSSRSVQRSAVAMLVTVTATAAATLPSIGCDDAITLAIDSDRPVPSGIDTICVGIADTSSSGGSFGRSYRLEGKLASLPQTLKVDPGEAATAYAWVRGDRGGVPVVRAGAITDFGDDVTLDLARCTRGNHGMPMPRGAAVGPSNAQLATSQGAGGQLVVAVAPGTAAIVDAGDTGDTGDTTDANVTDAPAPPAGAIRDVIAADLDRDCDDDLVIITDDSPPMLWIRDRTTFTPAGALGDAPAAAIAAADVDRDGSTDLVTGSGASLALWRNDGSATFTRDTENLVAGGRVASVRALALGDLDGDGNADLVVGQTGDPLVAWLGEPGGTGRFNPSPAAVPPVPLDVRAFTLADADGDLDPDLFVAIATGPARLYIARDGRLEDQSFLRLPDAPSDVAAFAIGGWDGSCEPDAIATTAAGSFALHGLPSGVLERESTIAAATDATMVDLDDDGALDAIISTAEGVQWLAR